MCGISSGTRQWAETGKWWRDYWRQKKGLPVVCYIKLQFFTIYFQLFAYHSVGEEAEFKIKRSHLCVHADSIFERTRWCTPVVTAALFTGARRWKQRKRPLMDVRVNKMWSIHTIKYYSALKSKKHLPHTIHNMDESWDHHAKWNKSDTTGQHCTIPLTWGICKLSNE